MARSLSRRSVLSAVLGSVSTLARAQQATFSSGVNVVTVLATVRDKQGELVRGLAKDDFVLEEEGKPQPIRYFSAQSGLPLALGLLVDTSGSQRTVLAEQRRASRQFLDKVLRPDDAAFLLQFDRQIHWIEGLTLPEPDLKKEGSQGTALYDALVAAARRIAAQGGRKALVVLSDGYDTSSAATLGEAIESAQRADALVYAIRFLDRDVFAFEVPAGQGGSPVPREGRKALERIAKETGGGYFDLAGPQTLAQAYARIEDELRNQYSLGFSPGGSRTGYRKLRVTVKRRQTSVRARDGYFPAP